MMCACRPCTMYVLSLSHSVTPDTGLGRQSYVHCYVLCTTHRHNYDNWHIGTHDVYGASTKQQLSKPGVYIAVKKGEKGGGGESMATC